jgi:hypothetical protein
MMLGGLKNQRYLLVIRKDRRMVCTRTGCIVW